MCRVGGLTSDIGIFGQSLDHNNSLKAFSVKVFNRSALAVEALAISSASSPASAQTKPTVMDWQYLACTP